MTTDIIFNNKAKPGKRFSLLNYCLSCSDPIPPDKDFCDNDICEYNFFDDSALAREEDEELIELEMMEQEEKKSKCFP